MRWIFAIGSFVFALLCLYFVNAQKLTRGVLSLVLAAVCLVGVVCTLACTDQSQADFYKDDGKPANKVTLEIYNGRVRVYFVPHFDDTFEVDAVAFLERGERVDPGNTCVAYIYKDEYGDHYLQIAGCEMEDTFAAPDTIVDYR